MSNQINYKQKYQELKNKFFTSVDTAFRLGFEQGSQQATQQAAQQQQMQAQQQAAGGQPGQSAGTGQGAEGSQPGAEQMANPNGADSAVSDSQNPDGTELDQHIATLEGMLGKSEVSADDIKKAMATVKAIKFSQDLKKSAHAIAGIATALHKPQFKLGQQASANMNDNAKRAVGMQEKIVSDIMKSWEEEEQQATKKVSTILSVENLTKKE